MIFLLGVLSLSILRGVYLDPLFIGDSVNRMLTHGYGIAMLTAMVYALELLGVPNNVSNPQD